jgi:hypothetical protein
MVGGCWGVAADHDPFLASCLLFDRFLGDGVDGYDLTICVRHEGLVEWLWRS